MSTSKVLEKNGISVAVDETMNLIVVGAKRDLDGGAKAGAVYLLERNSMGIWQPGGKVLASDAAISKEFGEDVAILCAGPVVPARQGAGGQVAASPKRQGFDDAAIAARLDL